MEKLGWRLEHASYFFMMTVLAPVGPIAGYSASKAAALSITQALRAELRDRASPCSAPTPAASTPTCSPTSRYPRRLLAG